MKNFYDHSDTNIQSTADFLREETMKKLYADCIDALNGADEDGCPRAVVAICIGNEEENILQKATLYINRVPLRFVELEIAFPEDAEAADTLLDLMTRFESELAKEEPIIRIEAIDPTGKYFMLTDFPASVHLASRSIIQRPHSLILAFEDESVRFCRDESIDIDAEDDESDHGGSYYE